MLGIKKSQDIPMKVANNFTSSLSNTMRVFTRGLLSLSVLAGSSHLRGLGVSHAMGMSTKINAAHTINPRVALGAGCYWGTEKYVKQKFLLKRGEVGFMNPNAQATAANPNPSYREVCSGSTGYVEVFDLELAEPTEEQFESLIKHFFAFHDPTTLDAQGNDRGTQYASVVFCYDDKQLQIVEKVKAEVQARLEQKQILDRRGIDAYAGREVTTAVVPATQFFPAEVEHQEYLDKNPGGYCNHRMRFQWEEL